MKDVLMRLNEAVKGSVLSESELAKDLGIHRTTLNRYLNGHVEMPANILVGILNKLGLRLDELMAEQSQAPKVLLRADEPSVVKQPFFMRTVNKLDFYNRALAALELSYPEVALPKRLHVEANDSVEIEYAAMETRRVLHLPERGPVTGLFKSLSRAVKLISFRDESGCSCDGFSVSSASFGVGIAINSGLDFERCLATAAHELGHAVLHPDDFAPLDQAPKSQRGKDPREKAAWAFAAHFLIPSADLHELFRSRVGPKGAFVPPSFVLSVKRLYGVSAAFLLTKLLNEKLIEGKTYGYLKKQFYGDDPTREREPLSSNDCSVFGSPESLFEEVVGRMYFSGKITESRTSELLEKDYEAMEEWLSKRYDAFEGPFEYAS